MSFTIPGMTLLTSSPTIDWIEPSSAHVIAGGADESTVGVVIDIMSCTEDTRKLLAYVVIQLDVTAKAGAGRC